MGFPGLVKPVSERRRGLQDAPRSALLLPDAYASFAVRRRHLRFVWFASAVDQRVSGWASALEGPPLLSDEAVSEPGVAERRGVVPMMVSNSSEAQALQAWRRLQDPEYRFNWCMLTGAEFRVQPPLAYSHILPEKWNVHVRQIQRVMRRLLLHGADAASSRRDTAVPSPMFRVAAAKSPPTAGDLTSEPDAGSDAEVYPAWGDLPSDQGSVSVSTDDDDGASLVDTGVEIDLLRGAIVVPRPRRRQYKPRTALQRTARQRNALRSTSPIQIDEAELDEPMTAPVSNTRRTAEGAQASSVNQEKEQAPSRAGAAAATTTNGSIGHISGSGARRSASAVAVHAGAVTSADRKRVQALMDQFEKEETERWTMTAKPKLALYQRWRKVQRYGNRVYLDQAQALEKQRDSVRTALLQSIRVRGCDDKAIHRQIARSSLPITLHGLLAARVFADLINVSHPPPRAQPVRAVASPVIESGEDVSGEDDSGSAVSGIDEGRGGIQNNDDERRAAVDGGSGGLVSGEDVDAGVVDLEEDDSLSDEHVSEDGNADLAGFIVSDDDVEDLADSPSSRSSAMAKHRRGWRRRGGGRVSNPDGSNVVIVSSQQHQVRPAVLGDDDDDDDNTTSNAYGSDTDSGVGAVPRAASEHPQKDSTEEKAVQQQDEAELYRLGETQQLLDEASQLDNDASTLLGVDSRSRRVSLKPAEPFAMAMDLDNDDDDGDTMAHCAATAELAAPEPAPAHVAASESSDDTGDEDTPEVVLTRRIKAARAQRDAPHRVQDMMLREIARTPMLDVRASPLLVHVWRSCTRRMRQVRDELAGNVGARRPGTNQRRRIRLITPGAVPVGRRKSEHTVTAAASAAGSETSEAISDEGAIDGDDDVDGDEDDELIDSSNPHGALSSRKVASRHRIASVTGRAERRRRYLGARSRRSHQRSAPSLILAAMPPQVKAKHLAVLEMVKRREKSKAASQQEQQPRQQSQHGSAAGGAAAATNEQPSSEDPMAFPLPGGGVFPLFPQLQVTLKPHQLLGVRFMWDRVTLGMKGKRISTSGGDGGGDGGDGGHGSENQDSQASSDDGDSGIGCILAHEMGLGKTLSALTLVAMFLCAGLGRFAVIIVPKTTLQGWTAQYERFIPTDVRRRLRFVVFDSDKRVRTGSNARHKMRNRKTVLEHWMDYSDGSILVISAVMFRSVCAPRGYPISASGQAEQPVAGGNSENNEHGQARDEVAGEASERADAGPDPRIAAMVTEIRAMLLDAPDLVILDEGHSIKNPKSQIAELTSKIYTPRRVILTGYPLQNNLTEYYVMINAIVPGLLSSPQRFKEIFSDPIEAGRAVDSSDTQKRLARSHTTLLSRMLAPYIDRRDAGLLVQELKPRHEYIVKLRPSKIQRKVLAKLIESSQLGSSPMSIMGLLTPVSLCLAHPSAVIRHVDRIHRSQQFVPSLARRSASRGQVPAVAPGAHAATTAVDTAAATATANANVAAATADTAAATATANVIPATATAAGSSEHVDPADVADNSAVEQTARAITERLVAQLGWDALPPSKREAMAQDMDLSPKMQLLMDICTAARASGEKVVVFSHHVAVINLVATLLEANGFSCMVMSGETPANERERMIKRFSESAEPMVFVSTTRTGGLGVNLQAASRLVLLDIGWNPSHDVQASVRIFRIGQQRETFVYWLITAGTFQESVHTMSVEKQALARRVVDRRNIRRNHSHSELAKMWRLDEVPVMDSIPGDVSDDVLRDVFAKRRDIFAGIQRMQSLLRDDPTEPTSEEQTIIDAQAKLLETQGLSAFRKSSIQQMPPALPSGMSAQQAAMLHRAMSPADATTAPAARSAMLHGPEPPSGPGVIPHALPASMAVPPRTSLPLTLSGASSLASPGSSAVSSSAATQALFSSEGPEKLPVLRVSARYGRVLWYVKSLGQRLSGLVNPDVAKLLEDVHTNLVTGWVTHNHHWPAMFPVFEADQIMCNLCSAHEVVLFATVDALLHHMESRHNLDARKALESMQNMIRTVRSRSKLRARTFQQGAGVQEVEFLYAELPVAISVRCADCHFYGHIDEVKQHTKDIVHSVSMMLVRFQPAPEGLRKPSRSVVLEPSQARKVLAQAVSCGVVFVRRGPGTVAAWPTPRQAAFVWPSGQSGANIESSPVTQPLPLAIDENGAASAPPPPPSSSSSASTGQSPRVSQQRMQESMHRSHQQNKQLEEQQQLEQLELPYPKYQQQQRQQHQKQHQKQLQQQQQPAALVLNRTSTASLTPSPGLSSPSAKSRAMAPGQSSQTPEVIDDHAAVITLQPTRRAGGSASARSVPSPATRAYPPTAPRPPQPPSLSPTSRSPPPPPPLSPLPLLTPTDVSRGQQTPSATYPIPLPAVTPPASKPVALSSLDSSPMTLHPWTADTPSPDLLRNAHKLHQSIGPRSGLGRSLISMAPSAVPQRGTALTQQQQRQQQQQQQQQLQLQQHQQQQQRKVGRTSSTLLGASRALLAQLPSKAAHMSPLAALQAQDDHLSSGDELEDRAMQVQSSKRPADSAPSETEAPASKRQRST